MTDTPDQSRDDAPLAASKSGSAAADATADTVPDARGGTITARSTTISRPADELFSFFRDFSNLPHFMENVERIEVLDPTRSHWVVKAPAGQTAEWDARVTEEQPGRLIAWTSEEGADVPNSGRVEFKPVEGRGTVVTVTILYDPPGGLIGKIIAKMFQREPAIQARRDLARFKQLMETGEVATPAKNRAEFEEMGL